MEEPKKISATTITELISKGVATAVALGLLWTFWCATGLGGSLGLISKSIPTVTYDIVADSVGRDGTGQNLQFPTAKLKEACRAPFFLRPVMNNASIAHVQVKYLEHVEPWKDLPC